MEIIEKALQVCKEKEKENKFSELEAISEQILKIDPENVPAKYFFALSKKRLDKADEYVEALEKIKNISVKKSELNTALGALCLDLEEVEESLSFHKKAIKLDKNNDDAWSKLGNCYNLTKQYKKAIKCLKRCHKLNKKNEECLIILSVVYLNLKKINKTIYYLKKVIELNNKSSAAKFNLGCALLSKEKNKQGWKYYAHRFENFGYFKEMPKDKFLIGKKISNQKILFLVEQGFGDIINFIRFIKDFKEKYPNCEVKLLINKYYDSSFRDFIKQNFVELMIEDIEDYKYDYWCSIIDIPRYLKMNKEDIKKSYYPYLKSTKVCDYSHFDKMYKIGICWAGNAGHPRDSDRSCSLSLFKEIYSIPNVKLFSLQKDLRLRKWPFIKDPIDLSNCSDIKAIDMSIYMNTWEETCSIINGLDLIISVDTSILHLAGALNKKTCALLQYSPDWRWGLKSSQTIWYPNTTLFRQKKIGDWDSVFQELNSFVKECAKISINNNI